MTRRIAFTNQKGGVSKTTTAAAVGSGLKKLGNRVLVLDLDPQRNLSNCVRSNLDCYQTTLHLLSGAYIPDKLVQHLTDFDFICASEQLTNAEQFINQTGKEFRLREALAEAFDDQYDYIIIDTPPALGILTVNALTAADEVIIPAQADTFSFEGIISLYKTINIIKKYCNQSLIVKGILIALYKQNTIIARDMVAAMEKAAEQMQTKIFDTKIRDAVAVKEAQAKQVSIFDYAPDSNPAIDYMAFINEYLGDKNNG